VPQRLAGIGGREARMTLWPLTAAVAVVTLVVARAHADGSFAGHAFAGAAVELGAALSLAAAGLLFWGSRPHNPIGPLLVAAAFAWVLPEWSNPEGSGALLFTLGLVGFLSCVPLIAHVALAYPSGRLAHRGTTAVVALGYLAAVGLIGLAATAVFDPRASGCSECPGNLVLVHGDSHLNEQLGRLGIRIAIVWAIVAAILIAVRLLRSSRSALKTIAPVLVAAIAYLGFACADLWHGVGRGFLSNDSADVRLWRLEGVALVLLSAGVGWGLVRARRTRTSVAELVVELGQGPRAAGARETLAAALGDPSLQLAYRRRSSAGYVDTTGEPVTPELGPDRATTPLVRDGREIAMIVHNAQLLSDPGLIEDAIAAARLAVENEQLQAEVRAQLHDIRASRARIVAAADAERQRLERDLHDGAQQRLVALSLGLRLLRNEAERSGTGEVIPVLEDADRELRRALADLREVAHGIYPAVLSDEGLAAALETLSERLPATVRLGHLPDGRFPASVEAAAYFAAAEIVRDLPEVDGGASIDVQQSNGELVVAVERSGAMDDADERLVEIADRVGALDGDVDVGAGSNGHVLMKARIPCG
jgi:signal transduction histidine kinase